MLHVPLYDEEKKCEIVFTLLNVQGLIGYNKLKSEEIKQVFSRSDIVLFTEVWSNDCFGYHVDGFNYYILHRINKNRRAQRDSGDIVCQN